MRGHEPLIALRRSGCTPPFGVSIETAEAPSAWPARWHAMGYEPSRAHVHIGPQERLHALDLRFVVGMDVYVDGTSARRVREVMVAVKAYQPARVVCVVFEHRGDNCKTVEMIDSKGELTWQAS